MSNKTVFKKILTWKLLSLGSMYAINKFISSSALLKNLLKKNPGDIYESTQGDIYYKKSGSGSPVLLIHDLDPSSSGYEWSYIEERLAQDHTVYTLDLLGCGRSDKPGITYTSYLYVLLIQNFIKDIIDEPVEILCSGLSSSFVIMAAQMDPEWISKITMVNPVSVRKLCHVTNEKSKLLKALISVPIVGTFIYNLIHCRKAVEYRLTTQDFFSPLHVQARTIDAFYEGAHRDFSKGKFLMASIDGHYINTDIRRSLSRLSIPVSMIFGEELKKAEDIAKEYLDLNDQIFTSFVSSTKRYPHMENPTEFLQML